MNKIKYFMLAMMAFIASATFTACSSDDDNKNNGNQSNYDRYQQAVNQTVNSQKKSDKVISSSILRLGCLSLFLFSHLYQQCPCW